jgi:hypothetical protein
MNRTSVIALIAVVVAVVGIPVGIVALTGGDDGPDTTRSPGEGINSSNTPADEAGDGQSPQAKRPGRGAAQGGKGKGGPPQHAKAFDETMTGVGYPAEITESGGPAVRAVERVAGAEVEGGQQTVVGADCRNGVCSVRYRSGPRGTGQIMDDQVRVLRTLFSDAKVRKVVLYVHHKTVGRKKDERPAFIVVTCTRRPGIVWSKLKARQIGNRCRVVDQAGGKLRSSVRRGRQSVKSASQGDAVPSGTPGGSGEGADAPPGAKPSGTPAPENVGSAKGEGRGKGGGR